MPGTLSEREAAGRELEEADKMPERHPFRPVFRISPYLDQLGKRRGKYTLVQRENHLPGSVICLPLQILTLAQVATI